MELQKYFLGLDLGTNSVGWACLHEEKILDAGVIIFDAAENPKNGKSLAEPRRIARLTRRRLQRRRIRMNKIACLLQKNGFINNIDEIQIPYNNNIWELRIKGLDHKLSDDELSKVIYHISKNRGFKSSKKELDNPENTELTKANGEMQKVLDAFTQSSSRTIAEYLFNTFGIKYQNIRNKFGSYTNLIKQDLNQSELELILSTQKEFGNPLINDQFIQELLDIFTFRKGLPSFEEKVGDCELEHLYKRAPRDAISSSLFRAWQDLNHLRYKSTLDSDWQVVLLEDRKKLIELSFIQKKITPSSITKILDIYQIEIINDESNKKKKEKEYLTNIDLDKIAKSLTFTSYHKLQVLEEWEQVKDNYSTLDAIIYCVAYLKEFKNLKTLKDPIIKELIQSLNWDDVIWENIFDRLSFDGTMGHSLQATWNLLPCFQLEDESGMPYTYDKCKEKAYPNSFNNRDSEDCKYVPKFNEHDITSPVVKRTLNQTRLLINKLISLHGKPSQINIEFARDLGKSMDDRRKIKKQQDENQANNEKYKEQCKELHISDPIMFRLWKEQNEICIYTGKQIGAMDLQTNNVEIDHILPISRSGDDSLMNKVLVFSSENQHKGSRTAYEYISSKGTQQLEDYKVRVDTSHLRYKKKERLLLDNFDDKKSQEYKSRHLNDTRYIAKALASHLDKTIRPKDQKYGYVMTIPGQATSILRKLWSMGDKDRAESHTHHALDAILIAGAGSKIKKWEKSVTILSRYNYKEDKGLSLGERALKNVERFGFDIPMPWEGFNNDAREYVRNNIFVSRLGKRKVNGAMHSETVMSRRENGDVIKTIKLNDLGKSNETDVLKKLKDMVDVKIVDGVATGRNTNVYNIIIDHARKFDWNMDEAFSSENAPSMPIKKDEPINIPKIRRIKVIASASSKLTLTNMNSDKRQSAVDSGDVIRLDLYKDSKNKYFVVPIYAFHYNELPEPEDQDSIFQFSIYKNDYLSFESDSGFIFEGKNLMCMEGYYNTASLAQIILFPDYKNYRTVVGISKVSNAKKYHIDILGNKHFVASSEKREERLTLKEVEKKWNKSQDKE